MPPLRHHPVCPLGSTPDNDSLCSGRLCRWWLLSKATGLEFNGANGRNAS